MTILSYDDAANARALAAPSERIPGLPSPGLVFLFVGWTVLAASMLGLGGMVFVGIFQSV